MTTKHAPPNTACFSDQQFRKYLTVTGWDLQREIEEHVEVCQLCESRLRRLTEENPRVMATTYPGRVQNENTDTPVTLERYECLELIDTGGFGVVWKMRDLHFNRVVAVKVMKARDVGHLQLKRRFFAEAQICSQLPHPNIIPVHDMGELPDGRGFYAMKLVHGQRLDRLTNGLDSLQEKMQLFERICQAIAFAHDRNVIHRDLKPANIMVGQHGEIQVMDWGLAKVLEQNTGPQLPSTIDSTDRVRETMRLDSDRTISGGGGVGTVAYMAPEQSVDGSAATPRSDVYSLGVILFEMLTGKRLFDEQRMQTQDAQFKSLREYDARLQEIVQLCLKPTPSARPENAGALLELITNFRRTLEQEAQDQKLENERQQAVLAESVKKRRLWIALASVLTLALVATGCAAWLTNEARNDAELARGKAQKSASENKRLAENRNDVINFLTANVFGKADPWKEANRDISFREVLDLATEDARQLEFDPEVKAEILIELGKVYFNLGEYAESLELMSLSQDICEQHLPETHPLHMTSLDQKGMILLRMEKFAEAEALLKRALVLQTEAIGEDHEDTIHSLAKLGDLYGNWGKPEQAIPITKQVLNRRTALFGAEYRFTLVSMNGLALLYDQVGRDQEAVDLLRKAHKIALEGEEGPESVFTMAYANNLALALIDVNKLDEAEKIAIENLATQRSVLGDAHSSVFGSRHTLARIHFALGRFEECLGECDSMLEDFGTPSIRRGVVLFLKAKCLAESKQNVASAEFARRANELLTQILGSGHRVEAEIIELLSRLEKSVPPSPQNEDR